LHTRCENDHVFFYCCANCKIKIDKAFYGRKSNTDKTCPGENPQLLNLPDGMTTCNATKFRGIVETACEDNAKLQFITHDHQGNALELSPGSQGIIVRACTIWNDNNQAGGDPCRGTYKYMQVKYHCMGMGWKSMENGYWKKVWKKV